MTTTEVIATKAHATSTTGQKPASFLKLLLVNLFFYAVDMATAIAGFYFGFGLQVQNWHALIFFMIISRWIVYVSKGVYGLHFERKTS